jgi:NADH-quinone oxidoreductase subunit A
MLFQYANVLFGLLFGVGFVLLNIYVLSRILAPRVEDPEKLTTYECGEPAVGSAWVRFDMRFYTTALVFLIFEVELAFLFPWAVVYNDLIEMGRATGGWFSSLFPFLEVAIFVLVLGVGLIYVWVKGDLDWVKDTDSQSARIPRRPPPEPSRREDPEEVSA